MKVVLRRSHDSARCCGHAWISGGLSVKSLSDLAGDTGGSGSLSWSCPLDCPFDNSSSSLPPVQHLGRSTDPGLTHTVLYPIFKYLSSSLPPVQHAGRSIDSVLCVYSTLSPARKLHVLSSLAQQAGCSGLTNHLSSNAASMRVYRNLSCLESAQKESLHLGKIRAQTPHYTSLGPLVWQRSVL